MYNGNVNKALAVMAIACHYNAKGNHVKVTAIVDKGVLLLIMDFSCITSTLLTFFHHE